MSDSSSSALTNHIEDPVVHDSNDRGARRHGRLYIDFELGEDLYAIDMTWVQRVVTRFKLFVVPCTPTFIAGMIDTGEGFVTIVNLRSFLEIRGADVEARSLIVIEVQGQQVGFLTDTIPGFLTLTKAIEPRQTAGFSILVGTCQYRGREVHILDAEQMVWILTGNFERLQDKLLSSVSTVDDEPELGVDEQFSKTDKLARSNCERCQGHHFVFVKPGQLLNTLSEVYNEYLTGTNATGLPEPLDIAEVIIQCFAMTSPVDAIHDHVGGMLPLRLFDMVLGALEINHLEPCPVCHIQ